MLTATQAALEPTAGTSLARLGRLFDAHHERLFRLARRMAADPEEAHDLVQETFLRAARRPGAVPAGEPAGEAWLVRVLVNLCRDRFRRLAVRARARQELGREPPGAGASAHPEAAVLARAAVQAALARLSPRRRAVVVLHELEEVPVERVARLLGIAQVTVRWHLAVGRKELASLLIGREGEEKHHDR
ncbi:MAG TPA: RNA polymerase sigma factor [Thermoanaerobaculia bacterium]|jgi:RNA polymerase sigma-70 factor (ECF subfamily)|nr:RNA polymerase sigma factor [Thermoanaerobaculia bacterium]